MDELKPVALGEDVSDEELKKYLQDFRLWVADREKVVPRAMLADAFGIARSTFYNWCDSEGLWTSSAGSIFWRWHDRRGALWAMNDSNTKRLALEFRKVSDTVGMRVLKVSQIWWAHGNYSELGVAVGGEGDQVTVLVLSQDDEPADDDADTDSISDGEIEADEDVVEEILPILESSGDPEDALLGGDGAMYDDEAAPDDDDVATVDDSEVESEGNDDISADGNMDEDFPPADAPDFVNLPSEVVASEALERFTPLQKERLVDRIKEAPTVEEVALLAGAPVLALVPWLSLEAAKEGALLRLSGWHPGHPKRDADGVVREYRVGPVGGLWGDGINMLYYGTEAAYADQGAQLVAFAPVTAWGPDKGVGFYAQQMRTGLTMADRRRKHAVPDHDGRGLYLGYRMANWAPERKYPDHDWFFGSEGTLDVAAVRFYIKDGQLPERALKGFQELAAKDIRMVPPELRRPSRAEVLSAWYRVRSMMDAFAEVEGFASSPFGLSLERQRLKMERMMLSDEYGITPYYYGESRSIPHSTRVSERRWMLERIEDIGAELESARRRLKFRRFFGSLFLGWARWLRRRNYQGRYRRLRGKGMVPGREGDPVVETEEFRSAGLGVGIVEVPYWERYEALSELPPERRYGSADPDALGGLDYTKWGATKVIWHNRDRGQWFTFVPVERGT